MRFLIVFRYHNMKITDAIQSFLLYISTERRLSALTVESYATDLRLFAEYIGNTHGISDVEDISHLEIRDWQMSLTEKEQHPNSIKRRLVTLRTFYRFLRRQGIVTTDVMAKIVTPKSPKRLPVFFTEKETARIYTANVFPDSFEGVRDRLLLCILYETGMRRAELLSLKNSSVDFHSGTIKVLGKRDKERIIPIENELSDNIKRYFSLKEQKEGCSNAFFVRSDGSPFTQYDVRKVVKQYMSQFSNADKISPHVFRHSFATHLLNEGADIDAIKNLLGHADLSATEIYTHVSRQHLKETYRHTHPREKRKNE